MIDEGRGRSTKRQNKSRYRSMSPILSNPDKSDADRYRSLCDYCRQPRKPGQPKRIGGLTMLVNAEKHSSSRPAAELALKLFNDHKMKSFKLLKVCKMNIIGSGYHAVTFRAQEDGIEECPLFRGIVQFLGGKREAFFCEIKENNEVTLLTRDDDYVREDGPSS